MVLNMIDEVNLRDQAAERLKSALEMDIIDYSPSEGFRKSDPIKLKLQGELIKEALDNMADINSLLAADKYLSSNLDSLATYKDVLLNHSYNSLTIEDFFKFVLQGYITQYNQTANMWGVDPSILKLQGELIQEALDKGVDLDSIFQDGYSVSNLESLAANKEILLNHPTNALNENVFLKLALQGQITEYNVTSGIFEIDYNKLNLQGELIKEARDRGGDISKIIDMHFISASLQTLATHKELLLSPTSKDVFLFMLLLSDCEQDGDVSLKYNLVEEVIKLGADLNKEFKTKMGYFVPLDINEDMEIGILLKANGASCNPQSKRAALFIEYEKLHDYAQNKDKYAEQISKNLAAIKAETNKIPYLIHHVWLTHPKSPKEIDPLDVATVIATKKTFEQSDKEWTHIVWTNDRSLIPNSVLKLEEHGVEVRSIDSLQFELRLLNQVYEQIDQMNWGTASDILRYSLVEHFGGVYADLNFHFIRNIEDELYKYDYFAQDFVNYFFAAKPKHPIMTELVNIVELNLFAPPPYLTGINETEAFAKTAYTSLLPFSLAYLRASNLDSNVDIVFPPTDEFEVNEKWLSEEYICPNFWTVLKFPEHLGFCGAQELAIGEDGRNGLHITWIED